MSPEPKFEGPVESHRRLRGLWRWRIILWLLVAWAVAAYLLVPRIWKTYFRHHRALGGVEQITHTGDGHPGDPLNIGLVGTERSNHPRDDGSRMVPGGCSSRSEAVSASWWIPFSAARTTKRRSALFIFSAASRIWLSSNLSVTARVRGITCDFGAPKNGKRAVHSG